MTSPFNRDLPAASIHHCELFLHGKRQLQSVASTVVIKLRWGQPAATASHSKCPSREQCASVENPNSRIFPFPGVKSAYPAFPYWRRRTIRASFTEAALLQKRHVMLTTRKLPAGRKPHPSAPRSSPRSFSRGLEAAVRHSARFIAEDEILNAPSRRKEFGSSPQPFATAFSKLQSRR